MQKERQEKQEKEEGEKKEKQKQEAEEMIRKMHEGTDSVEDRAAGKTEQKEAKASGNDAVACAQVPERAGETVEVDTEASRTNTDKTTTKPNASVSSSEEIDEEALDGEEKIGKDGQ